MGRIGKNRLVIFVILLAIASLLFFFRNKKQLPAVAVASITTKTMVETIQAAGQLFPSSEIKISPPFIGEIVNVYVQEGDTVRKGQALATIKQQSIAGVSNISIPQSTSPSVSKNAIQLQEKVFEMANANYKKAVADFAKNNINKEQLEQATAAKDAASENLQMAKKAPAYTPAPTSNKASVQTILAPMDGVVTVMRARVGEFYNGNAMSSNGALFSIANLSNWEMKTQVNENEILQVHEGDSCWMEVAAYGNRKFKGKVSYVAASLKQSANSLGIAAESQGYEVWIALQLDDELKNGNAAPFRSGMNASATIITQVKQNVKAIPQSAIISQAEVEGESNVLGSEEGYQVFVVNTDNIVQLRKVKIGVQDMADIEILEGLKEREKVVVAPYALIQTRLKEGMKIIIVDKAKLLVKEEEQ